eukprot:gene30268-39488_t
MGCSSSSNKDEDFLSSSYHGEVVEEGLSPTEFRSCKIRKITQLSADTKSYEVVLPDPKAKMVGTTSYFLLVKGPPGDESMRPYTPTSPSGQVGFFELVIKFYPDGKVSSYLNTLKVNDYLEVKGPIDKIKYSPNMKQNIGMFAVIKEVLSNPADKATISLLFANRTEKDILLKSTLDALAKKHKNFKVTYILSRPTAAWTGLKGYVNAENLSLMPAPGEETLIYVCGPPGFMDLISGDKSPDKQQGFLSGFLREKGYTDAFQKAFGSRSPGNVSVLEVGYFGNINNDISKLKERYKWETNFLCFALDVLIKEEDAQQLRTLLGLLGLGNQACEARRRMAFITVVHNAAERLLQLNRISEGSVKDFVDPKGYLSNKCVDFIEEIKENAFRSVFLEPAMMYFDAVRDHTASGDVDVHGSNLYLAVLQATTGIIIPRMPLWEDDCKGCADSASTGLNDLIGLVQYPGDAMKPGGNIGKAYRTVIGSRSVRATKHVRSDAFIFRASGIVFNFAKTAADERRSSQVERQHFAQHYLEPFVAYFTPTAILPLLFNYCIQDVSTARALQQVFEEFKQQQQGEGIEETEVMNWVWDAEKIPPDFKTVNARQLFAYCGIVSPA